MSSTEEHVVSMRFNNKQFERNAQKSLGTIDRLKKAMNFGESAKGLKKMQDQADKFSLDKMGDQISNIEKKLSVMGVVGMSVINRLTNDAIDAGKKLVKGFLTPLNQIKTGGWARATKIDTAQFQMEGLLQDMKKANGEMLTFAERSKLVGDILQGPVKNAVDGTAYGMDAAAGAAAQLLSSGVQLQDLEKPLLAISGAAAMTGRSYEDIGNIFATVAGQGKLMTMQLRQFEAANVNVASVIAKSMNKSEAEVRDMVTHGKISFEQFSKAMSDAFGDQAKRANETFEGALSNVKAALNKIGELFATPLRATSRDILNDVRPVINAFKDQLGPVVERFKSILDEVSESVNKLFYDKKGNLSEKSLMGVRRAANFVGIAIDKIRPLITAVLKVVSSLGSVFKTLMSYIEPVITGFFDIFPKASLENIAKAADKIKEVAKNLRLSKVVAENVRKVFRGIFSVLHGVYSIGKTITGMFFSFVKALAPAGVALSNVFGVFGDILSNVGYYLELISVAITYTLDYFNVFEALGSIIGNLFGAVFDLVKSIFTAVGSVISFVLNAIAKALGATGPIIEGPLDLLGIAFAALGFVINVVVSAIQGLSEIIRIIAGYFISATESMNGFTGGLKDASKQGNIFQGILNAIVYVITAIARGLVAAWNGITSLFAGEGDGKGVFGKLKDALVGVWEYIKKFTTSTFPGFMDKVGGALARLGAIIKDLTANLTPGNVAAAAFVVILIAISAGIARLMWHLSDLTKGLVGLTSSVKGFFNALTARIKPAVATKISNIIREITYLVLALAAAIFMLSKINNLESVVKNLGYVAAGVAALSVIMIALSALATKGKMAASLTALGIAMLAASVGVMAIAAGLKMLDGISTEGIIEKAEAVAIMIGALGLSAALMTRISKDSARGAISLLAFAFAVNRLVKALVEISQAGELQDIQNSLPTLLGIMAGLALLSFAMGRIKLTSGLSFILVVYAIKMLLPVLADLIDQVKSLVGGGGLKTLMEFVREYQDVLTFLVGASVVAIAAATILQKSMRGLAIGLLAMIGAIYLFIQLALLINKIPFDSISYGLAVIGGFLAVFMGFMVLSKYLVGSHPMKFAASLLMMSAAIGILVGIAWLIGQMNQDNLWKGMKVISLLLAIFGVLMMLSSLTEKAKPLQMGVSFILMAGAIAALIGCVYLIGNMDPKAVSQGTSHVILLGAMLAGFVALSQFTKDANLKGLADMFLSLAAAIGVITFCISLIAQLKFSEAVQGTVVVGAIMGLLMYMVKSLQKFTESGKRWVAGRTITLIGSISALIGVMLLAISEIAKYDVGTLLKAGTVILGSVLLVENFVKKISEVSKEIKAGATIVVIGGFIASLGAIIASLVVLGNQNQSKLFSSAVILLAVTELMSVIFKKIQKSKPNPKAVATFMLATISALTLASALAIVNINGSFSKTISAGIGLSMLVVVFTKVFDQINSAKPNIKAIGSFILASTALLIFAGAIAIANVSGNFLRTAAAAAGLAVIVVVFAEVFKEIQQATVKTKAITNFITASLAMLIFAASIAAVNSSGNIARTAVSTAALATLTVIFADVLKKVQAVTVKTKAIHNFIAAASTIVMFATSIAAINMSGNIFDTIVSTAALIVLTDVFSTIFKKISTTPVVASSIVGFIGASLAVCMLASSIAKVAGSAKWIDIAASAAGIGFVMSVMGKLFNYISTVNPSVKSIGKFALACLSIYEVALGISKLANSANWDSIAVSAAGIGLVLAVMGEIFKLIGTIQIKMSAIGKFMLACVSVAEVAVGIMLLTQSGNWSSIAAAGASLTAVLTTMGGVFDVISYTVVPNAGVIGAFLAACISAGEIALSIAAIAHYGNDWASILAAGAGLSSALIVMAGVFDTIMFTPINPAAVGAFDAASAALIPMALSLGQLAQVGSWGQIVAAAGALDATLVTLAGVCTFLGAPGVGPIAVKGALYASAIMGIFTGVAAALVTVAGIINSISGGTAKKWIEDAGETLHAFTKAIGRFIGGFIEGIGESICDLIAYLGEKLGEFGENAKPFFEALKEIDDTAIQGAKALVEIALMLGATSFLDGLTNFIGLKGIKDDGFRSSMTRLMTFASVVNEFADATSKIKNINNFKVVTEAAKKLSELADELEPGLFEAIGEKLGAAIVGDNDLGKKAEKLSKLFGAVKDMSSAMNNVDAAQIDKLKLCTDVLKNLSDAIPNDGGIWQGIAGYKDFAAAGDGMVSFAKRMSLIRDIGTGEIDVEAIKKVGEAAKVLAALSADMPESQDFSIKKLFVGSKEDIGTFGMRCVALAKAMGDVTTEVSGKYIDPEVTKVVADAAGVFVKLAKTLPKKSIFRFGDYLSFGEMQTISDLAGDLSSFADGIVEMNGKLHGVNFDQLLKITPFIESLGKIALGAAGLGESGFTGFTNTFDNFGNAITKFNTNIKDLDNDKAKSFVGVLDDLLKMFNDKFGGSENKYKGMTSLFRNITKLSDSIDKLVKSSETNLTDFGDRINQFKTYLTDLISAFKDANQNGDFDTMSEKIEKIKNMMKDPSGNAKTNDYKEFSTFATNLDMIAKAAQTLTSGESNVAELEDNLTKLGQAYVSFINSVKDISGGKDGDIAAAKKNLEEIRDAIVAFNGKKLSTKQLEASAKQLNSAAKSIKKAMNTLLDASENKISTISENAVKLVDSFTNSLTTSNAQVKINKAGATMVDKLAGSINSNRSKISSPANNVIDSFCNTVTGSTSGYKLSNAGVKVANKFIEGLKSKKALDINSPSKAVRKIALSTGEGFVDGVKKSTPAIKMSAKNIANEFTKSLGAGDIGGSILNAAKNTVSGIIDGAKSFASKLFGGSGESFGSDFLGGLRKAWEKVKKGKFNGEEVMKKLKEKLDFNNLLDPKKGKSADFQKYFQKSMKNAAKGAAGASRGSGGGGSAAKEAAKFTQKDWLEAFQAMGDIAGKTMTAKMLASAINVSKKVASTIIKSYKSEISGMDSSLTKMLMKNQTALLKYANQWVKNNNYVAKEADRMNKSIGDSSKEITTKSIKTFGLYLAHRDSDYKKSVKSIEKYNKQIEKNEKKAGKLLLKLDKTKSAKRKKTLKDELVNLEKETRKLRKEQAKEWDKIGKAPTKALKNFRKEIKSTISAFHDLSHLNTSSNAVATGLEVVSDTASNSATSVDIFSNSLNEATNTANEAAEAYDGLNESMDTGIDLFNRFTKVGTVEADAMFENADSQLEAYEEFQNGLTALEEKGLSSYVIDKLAEEGPQALSKIRGYLNMTKEQVESYNERIDKLEEYELQAFERRLQKQAKAYEKYLENLSALTARYSNGEYGGVLAAVKNLGFGGANVVSMLLRADDESLASINKNVALGLGQAIITASNAVSTDTTVTNTLQKNGKNLYLTWLSAIEDNEEQTKTLDKLKADVMEKFNIPEDMADYIYNQGYETGSKIFQGILDGSDVDAQRGIQLWTKNNEKATKDYFSGIEDQVNKQDKYITQNTLMRANIGTFLEAWAKKNPLVKGGTEAAVSRYTEAFETLVKELEEKGLDSTEIMEQLNTWMADEDAGWDTLISKLELIAKRSENNAKLTGKAIQQSWYQESEDMVKYGDNLTEVVEKFGDHMNLSLWNKIKLMSPEEIAALNELSPEDLQAMADNWWDSKKAATIITDKVEASVINGIKDAMANAEAWMRNYDYNKDRKVKDMTKDDRTYEIAKWLESERATGKTVKEALNELKAMDEAQMNSIFKANSKNKFKDVKAIAKWLKNNRNKTWDEISEGLTGKGSFIDGIAKDREKIFGEAINSGENIEDLVAGNVVSFLTGGYKKAAEELATEGSAARVALSNGVSVIYKAITKPDKKTQEELAEGSSKVVKQNADKVFQNSKDTYTSNGKKLAKKEANGFNKEYEAKEGDMATKVKTVAKEVYNDANNTYQKYGTKLGEAMAEGMNTGFMSKSSLIIAAAEDAAWRAYEAAKAKLGINSPSKEFAKLGAGSMEGFAKGVYDNENVATDSVLSITESTLTGMRNAIGMINDAINGELNISPTITPTLDLSYVSRQANSVGHLFDATVGLQYQNEGTENQNSKPVSNTTFIQNNYSPKALSREEIYRRTKNQFAMAREAVTV